MESHPPEACRKQAWGPATRRPSSFEIEVPPPKSPPHGPHLTPLVLPIHPFPKPAFSPPSCRRCELQVRPHWLD